MQCRKKTSRRTLQQPLPWTKWHHLIHVLFLVSLRHLILCYQDRHNIKKVKLLVTTQRLINLTLRTHPLTQRTYALFNGIKISLIQAYFAAPQLIQTILSASRELRTINVRHKRETEVLKWTERMWCSPNSTLTTRKLECWHPYAFTTKCDTVLAVCH